MRNNLTNNHIIRKKKKKTLHQCSVQWIWEYRLKGPRSSLLYLSLDLPVHSIHNAHKWPSHPRRKVTWISPFQTLNFTFISNFLCKCESFGLTLIYWIKFYSMPLYLHGHEIFEIVGNFSQSFPKRIFSLCGHSCHKLLPSECILILSYSAHPVSLSSTAPHSPYPSLPSHTSYSSPNLSPCCPQVQVTFSAWWPLPSKHPHST